MCEPHQQSRRAPTQSRSVQPWPSQRRLHRSGHRTDTEQQHTWIQSLWSFSFTVKSGCVVIHTWQAWNKLSKSHMCFRISMQFSPFRGFLACTWAGRRQELSHWPRLQRRGGTTQAHWGCQAAPDPSYTAGETHLSLEHHWELHSTAETGAEVTNLSFSASSSFLTVMWWWEEEKEACQRLFHGWQEFKKDYL